MKAKRVLTDREIRALQMFEGRKEVPDSMMKETLRGLAAKCFVTKRNAIIGYRNYYSITDAGRAVLKKEEAA